jgi:hypothetical protein
VILTNRVVARAQIVPRAGSLRRLRFRKRLLKVCASTYRIDSADESRKIPNFTQVTPEQSVRLLQSRIIVMAINDLRRSRNASILTKLVHAINRHGAPEAKTDKIPHARPSASPAACKTLLLWESPPTFRQSLSVNICGKCQAKVLG